MLKRYLAEISKSEIDLIEFIQITEDSIINNTIFPFDFSGNVYEYRVVFMKKLLIKNNLLLDIIDKISSDSSLDSVTHQILTEEINNKLLKISFLKDTYDIEASKVDSDYIYNHKEVDYSYYNLKFFGIKNYPQDETLNIAPHTGTIKMVSQDILQELISYSNSICPDIIFKFGDFALFSHTLGTLNVPQKKEYTLQNIITLFFHETTHFFRGYNGRSNLGFNYDFGDSGTLEEGIAIYNEYLYGNQVTDYGKFIPYYNRCYQILQEDISEKEKQNKIHDILQLKGFNREKSLSYYYRFHRYTLIGGKDFFFKDLIYNSGLKTVSELLLKDNSNYEKIMAAHIGTFELDNKIIGIEGNFDSRKYFCKMVEKINLLVK